MELSFAVVAVAALVQCFLLVMARRDARYWREKYMAAMSGRDSLIERISKQRDDVLAGWNKTTDDLNRATAQFVAFRKRVEEHLGETREAMP